VWELLFAVVVTLLSFAINYWEKEKKKKEKEELDKLGLPKEIISNQYIDDEFELKTFSTVLKTKKSKPFFKQNKLSKKVKNEQETLDFQKQSYENIMDDKQENLTQIQEVNINNNNNLTDMILNNRMSAFVAYEVLGPPKSLRKD
jgi:hypothetical protein